MSNALITRVASFAVAEHEESVAQAPFMVELTKIVFERALTYGDESGVGRLLYNLD